MMRRPNLIAGMCQYISYSGSSRRMARATTAMSLADFTISILSALSTVTVVPALKPILDGACATAFGDTVSSVSIERRLSFTALSVRYIVISLVVEAGYHG